MPRLNPKTGPSALFQPMIVSSRNILLDCDYNFHKSNSTYFQDFDVARLNLLVYLVGRGMQRTGKELGGTVSLMLGGVSCNFKREIKPYQAFEMWSRVFCWDHKWLYTITHFVKKDSVRPKGYTLQPWRKAKAASNGHKSNGGIENVEANDEAVKPGLHPAIFACAISKYVFKQGRLTIPPEKVLKHSYLLPPNPSASASKSSTLTLTSSPSIEGTSLEAAAASALPGLKPSKSEADNLVDAPLTSSADGDGVWDWDRIETERRRGMRIAECYAGLEALNEEFTYENKASLGAFGDF